MARPLTRVQQLVQEVRDRLGSSGNRFHSAALRDLFALACHLHAHFDKTAGTKTARRALRAAGFSVAEARTILETLDGNEREFFSAAQTGLELRRLFPELR